MTLRAKANGCALRKTSKATSDWKPVGRGAYIFKKRAPGQALRCDGAAPLPRFHDNKDQQQQQPAFPPPPLHLQPLAAPVKVVPGTCKAGTSRPPWETTLLVPFPATGKLCLGLVSQERGAALQQERATSRWRFCPGLSLGSEVPLVVIRFVRPPLFPVFSLCLVCFRDSYVMG